MKIKSLLKSNKACQSQKLFKITKEEEGAIRQYKSSDAYKINDSLRSIGYENLPEDSKKQIDNISTGLRKLPKYDKILYRNVGLDSMRKFNGDEKAIEFINEHRKGNIVTYDGFTSTSKSKDGYLIDEESQANIEIIKNKNGRDITGFPGVPGEDEVLFDRNSKFKILDSKWTKDYNKYRFIVKMEEL